MKRPTLFASGRWRLRRATKTKWLGMSLEHGGSGRAQPRSREIKRKPMQRIPWAPRRRSTHRATHGTRGTLMTMVSCRCRTSSSGTASATNWSTTCSFSCPKLGMPSKRTSSCRCCSMRTSRSSQPLPTGMVAPVCWSAARALGRHPSHSTFCSSCTRPTAP